MKKIKFLLLLSTLIIGLTACSGSIEDAQTIEVNTAQNSEIYVEGEDYQTNWNDWNSGFAQLSATGEGGYYYYDLRGDSLLHFRDFASDTTVVLCNQPNCDHTGIDCNANITSLGAHVYYLFYYDGNIYLICDTAGLTQDICVYRVSADGSIRGKVGVFFSLSGESTINCIVHRGYVYCALNPGDPEHKDKLDIYRLALSGGEEAEIIHTFDSAYGPSVQMKAYGNNLYIRNQYYKEPASNETSEIYRYDIHTGELEFLLEYGGNPFIADDRYIYYSTDSQVLAFDLEAKESVVLIDEGPMFLTLDGDKLYCDNRLYVRLLADNNYDLREITVIDTNTFEEIVRIPLTVTNTYFAGTCGSDIIADLRDVFLIADLEIALTGEAIQWEQMD